MFTYKMIKVFLWIAFRRQTSIFSEVCLNRESDKAGMIRKHEARRYLVPVTPFAHRT